jgi:spermidine/putrescine transport system substrate-binding protein
VGCTAGSKNQSSRELRVLTWSDYLVPEVMAEFEQENSAKIKLDYFSSNEELLAKVQTSVQAGGKGYDVIFPSDYMVGNMKMLKLLAPIDKTKIPAIESFMTTFREPIYDPKLEHSVPFSWGTTGLAFNKKLLGAMDVQKMNISWKEFFESPSWAKQIAVLDDSKEVLHAALLSLGKKWGDVNEASVKEAFEYLKTQKKNLKLFAAQAQVPLENGECTLCQAFSGDAIRVMGIKSEVGYLIPKEGATIWSDNLAIPVNSANQELAHKFIAKILEPKAAARFTEMSHFATPHKIEVVPLAEEIKKNRAIYPDTQTQKRLYFLSENPELMSLIDRLWTELKSL